MPRFTDEQLRQRDSHMEQLWRESPITVAQALGTLNDAKHLRIVHHDASGETIVPFFQITVMGSSGILELHTGTSPHHFPEQFRKAVDAIKYQEPTQPYTVIGFTSKHGKAIGHQLEAVNEERATAQFHLHYQGKHGDVLTVLPGHQAPYGLDTYGYDGNGNTVRVNG